MELKVFPLVEVSSSSTKGSWRSPLAGSRNPVTVCAIFNSPVHQGVEQFKSPVLTSYAIHAFDFNVKAVLSEQHCTNSTMEARNTDMSSCLKTMSFSGSVMRRFTGLHIFRMKVCTGVHDFLQTDDVGHLAVAWKRATHHAWSIPFILEKQICCPLGINPLGFAASESSCSILSGPYIESDPCPPTTLKRCTRRHIWWQFKGSECTWPPIEELESGSWLYWDHNFFNMV